MQVEHRGRAVKAELGALRVVDLGERVLYPRDMLLGIAHELVRGLAPLCEDGRCLVVGSLRRGARMSKDVEILYVPRVERRADPGDLFGTVDVDLAHEWVVGQVNAGRLALRRGEGGTTAFGARNKLLVWLGGAERVPVDLFAARPDTWFNQLVCRTGPKESNMRVARAAQAMGLTWRPYESGFTDEGGEVWPVTSEASVFETVGLVARVPALR